MQRTTITRRVTLSGLAAAVLVTLGSVTAAAHVTITPSTTAAGATAVLRLEIPHGCEGSATTAVSVRMPEDVADVTASGTDRWTVDQAPDALTWTTDEPLPDGEHAEVELTVRLPDDTGATLVFPVIQKCEDGEAAWTEVAEHGEGAEHLEGDEHGAGHEELDRPAPVLVVTAGDNAGKVAADADGSSSREPEPASAADGAADRGPLITYGAAGILAAGILAGGAVLLRRRRNR
ncbi:YcnI family protein [Promicromonospora iranensis]|uniref:Uncharacterized protein YcnI n=1 Tax=Promicromonospora iranensis TaxID=1105144 RepID=A0ABU2CUN6_9MICO|nr:YcnI family protein [Promicromonospora iranensis]MDR7385054.1 uncharacterized protein YcnI [Promicromonospora iranensis]